MNVKEILWICRLLKYHQLRISRQIFISLEIILNVFTEAVTRGVFSEKVFLEILQNSQENTCARVSFLIKLQENTCARVSFLIKLQAAPRFNVLEQRWNNVYLMLEMKQNSKSDFQLCIMLINLVVRRWNNVEKKLQNFDTALSQRCLSVLSMLVKVISKPIGLVTSMNLQRNN